MGAGFCLGLAVGARLTFAPLAAPFLLAILFFPNESLRRKVALGAIFGAAALVALSPVIWLFCSAPDQFWFGNFEFPRLRLLKFEPSGIELLLRDHIQIGDEAEIGTERE